MKSCCKKSRVNDAELPNYILILVSEGTGYGRLTARGLPASGPALYSGTAHDRIVILGLNGAEPKLEPSAVQPAT